MPDRELVSLLLPPLTLGLAWRRWRRDAMPDRELCFSAPLAADLVPGSEAAAEGNAAGRGVRSCASRR